MSCCKKASIDTRSLIPNVSTRADQEENRFPSDINTALSKTRIVTATNFDIVIHDRNTNDKIYSDNYANFFSSIRGDDGTGNNIFNTYADPVVVYDEVTERFYYMFWDEVNRFATANLTIESPNSINGTYTAVAGLQSASLNFNLGSPDFQGIEIVLADPLNASAPLVGAFPPVQLLTASGHGPLADPYLPYSVPVTMKGNEEIRIVFKKDSVWYAGVDSCYFILQDLSITNPPEGPVPLPLQTAPLGPIATNTSFDVNGLRIRTGPSTLWDVYELGSDTSTTKYSLDVDGTRVIRCGQQDTFKGGAGGPGGPNPPLDSSVQIIYISTVDGDPNRDYSFTLLARNSSENGYDFLRISKIAQTAWSGKIALVAADGFTVGSSTKGLNCFNAGATAMIIYYDPDDTFINISGSADIPSIATTYETGKLIKDAIEGGDQVFGGMKNSRWSTFYSRFFLAVSKNDSPNGTDDWWKYVVGDENGPLKFIGADYPKLGVDKNAIYIQSRAFDPIEIFDGQGFAFANSILAISKDLVLNGPSSSTALPLLLADLRLDGDDVKVLSSTIPSYVKPKNSKNFTCFVALKFTDETGPGHQLLVRVLKDILTVPTFTEFILDVNPWDSGALGSGGSKNPIQPNGYWQNAINYPPMAIGSGATRAEIQYRCIQDGDSLWCAFTPVKDVVDDPLHHVVRWYEIDISHADDPHNPSISLKQEGEIDAGGTTSCIYPSLDIDKCGNMGIGFNVVGPSQELAIAHTGRLKSDPPGTVRFPLPTDFVAQPNYPFFENRDLGDGVLRSATRFNDYTSTQVDPRDGRTFWHANSYSDLDIPLYEQRNSTGWKAGLVSWKLDRSCPGNTYCAQTPVPSALPSVPANVPTLTRKRPDEPYDQHTDRRAPPCPLDKNVK